MFVPILTNVFNHWFAQRTISVHIIKSVITLLKKGGRDAWEHLDDYKPITLLNTDLKILARVLANHLQIVVSDLIGTEENYAVKRKLIQNNLHLVHKSIEGIEDDNEAALINLDQSKAFDRRNLRFLAVVLKTARFEPEFRKWMHLIAPPPYPHLETPAPQAEG